MYAINLLFVVSESDETVSITLPVFDEESGSYIEDSNISFLSKLYSFSEFDRITSQGEVAILMAYICCSHLTLLIN